jgi:hypothetical protein
MKKFQTNLKINYNLPIYIKYMEPYKISYNFISKMKTPIRNTTRVQHIDVNSELHSQR